MNEQIEHGYHHVALLAEAKELAASLGVDFDSATQAERQSYVSFVVREYHRGRPYPRV